jgi:multidrug efflux system membrane fusion protein
MKEDDMEESPATPPRPDGPDSQLNPNRSMKRRVIVWVAVLLFFAGLLAWVLRPQSATKVAAQGRRAAMLSGPVAVVPATAQKGDIGVYQEAIGTVTPVYTSSVTSQVTGLVMSVHYREGQLVRKGDPLIDIDPRTFEAQLAQALGTLEKDTQILAQARMDLQRYRDAWARNAIAKQILDDQEKLVLQYEGTVKSDQGLVEYDRAQLSYCHLTAPFNGRVGLRLVDPGNVVQANGTNPLVVITQEQPITVIFTVAEDTLGQVQAQLRRGTRLTVDAYDRTALTKIASGKLLSLDNQIDTTTGTVKLRALFDNRSRALFPNQFVNIRLLVETLKNMTLIPTSAIQHNGQMAFVYVIQNETAQMRTVKTGTVNAGMTAVDGVQPGEVVANSSFEKLQPNVKVALAQGSQPATTSGSTLP